MLPEVIIVFDRFYVKAHLSRAVDKVRTAEHRELQVVGDERLKGTKYKWLKSFEDRRVKAAVAFRKLLAHDLHSGGTQFVDPAAEDSGQRAAEVRDLPREGSLPPRQARTPPFAMKIPPSIPQSPNGADLGESEGRASS